MKMLRSLLSLLCTAMLLGSSQQLEARLQQLSPLRQLGYSVWCEFPAIDPTNLSQEELTYTYVAMCDDLNKFCKRHGIKRVIFRILDPSSCDFFNPTQFNPSRDENIVYWLNQFRENGVDFEALFDGGTFHCDSQTPLERLQEILKYAWEGSPYGKFFNLTEKLQWVSRVNDCHPQSGSFKGPLIKGITINPQNESEGVRQEIVNAIDKYKHNADPELPRNEYKELRAAMVCYPDQKDFTLANIASYPLDRHLQSMDQKGLGVSLPENFPSDPPYYSPPKWRCSHLEDSDGAAQGPLLQTVYVFLDGPHLNKRLCGPAKNKNSEQNTRRILNLFKGKCLVNGPGTISIAKNSSTVQGTSTLFLTGRHDRTGRLRKGSTIKILLPDGKSSVRRVIADPKDDFSAKINSPVSDEEIQNAEYRSSFGDDWSDPKVSYPTKNRIYLCFEVHPENFGQLSLQDFLRITSCRYKRGIFDEPLFSLIHPDRKAPLSNNLVMRDFTQIPNGTPPYGDHNWGLGNLARCGGIICAY